MARISWRTLAAVAVAAAVALIGPAARVEVKVSKPFKYQGYSERNYPRIEKSSAYVPMSDGVKLAIDIYVPAGGPASSFPVLIEYTPYTRAFIDINNSPLHRMLRKALLKSDSPVLDLLTVPGEMADALRDLIGYGYVFVRADIRGCGASSGWKSDFMPRIGQDGGELVDWIARQPWCNGNVGMVGGSYSGYTQIVTAGYAGPALKAIAPTVVPVDGYDGEVYPGGVYLWGFMSAYSARLQRLNLNYYDLTLTNVILKKDIMLPAAPVVDEDNDGDLTDEIPIDRNHNGTFLDDYQYPDNPNDPPQYPDGKTREHLYYLAVRDHRANVDYHRWAQTLLYIDAKLPKPLAEFSSYDCSPSAQIPAIMKKGIAVYNIGGWFDPFVRGTTEYFATLRATNPSRMLIHPGYHGGGGPYWEYLGEKDFKGLIPLIAPELLRFFDHYLKGVDNGIDREDPILLYVMNGGGWRQEKEWPLARQTVADWYFGEGQALARERAGSGSDRYRADFTHDSSYGENKGNRYLSAMGQEPNALPVRTEKDKQCLTYTGAPLAADTEVTGHPLLSFWVSSSADQTDFFVYLEDVDEKGQSVLVTEGVLRGNYAGLVDNDEMIMGGGSGVNVLPDLPWHGFKRENYVDSNFRGGKILELTIDLKPTSWVFRKGHALRVAIACADWPTFRLHPRLSTDNNPKNPANVVPIITVYRDAEHPSRLLLPVIP